VNIRQKTFKESMEPLFVEYMGLVDASNSAIKKKTARNDEDVTRELLDIKKKILDERSVLAK